ncbi:RNA polymerase sigma-70 factor [Pedobacter sp. MC2016-14]|uniref:RNA polymerase sigma factor n=1 Tax=Pedobacter sp. MC2016-14 TaxID=2897327 RepID=UPI001E3F3013|nr:RNA polymerase sigma-70 factor [Pedobacter sp. MC2016-14]MCD0487470.1 RNA polymerase sigma-70 factor [Pedobacter sp. MC2016-14]
MNDEPSGYENEAYLLSQLKSGNQQAFSYIFKQFYPALCFFCNRLIANNAAAEEIVQDTLYKVWEKNEDFKSLISIKAFLYISTRNASMNFIDKERRKLKKETELFEMTEDMEEPVIRDIIYTEVLNEIRTEINNLPEQCGKIIKMLYEEEMKPQEIADELNIKVSTVYNQKMRGISILKTRLSGATFDLLMLYLIVNS